MSRIGKFIGGALYLHRNYQHEIPAGVLRAALQVANGFAYHVVKWDTKTNNVTFIQCSTFDLLPEPIMGAAMMVRPDGTSRFLKPLADPWVYHHKYAFVGPDYTGFDVAAAKRRQKAIDNLPGVDKSRIGKKSVNSAVTATLGAIERNNVCATSIRQVSAIFKKIKWDRLTRNADVGGGKWPDGTDYLRDEHKVKNLVYDPFCRPETYKKVGSLLAAEPADTGTLANVLNVIEDKANRLAVLRDLARFVKPGGKVYIGIYEASGTGIGANTKTGSWQNNAKSAFYLDEVRSVFPGAKLSSKMFTCTAPGGLSGLSRKVNTGKISHYAAMGVGGLSGVTLQQLKRLQQQDRAAMRKAGYTNIEAWVHREDDDENDNVMPALPHVSHVKTFNHRQFNATLRITEWPIHKFLYDAYPKVSGVFSTAGRLDANKVSAYLMREYNGLERAVAEAVSEEFVNKVVGRPPVTPDKIGTQEHFNKIIDKEYAAYPEYFERKGVLDLRAVADWLNDAADDILGSNDPKKVVKEWAKTTRPNQFKRVQDATARRWWGWLNTEIVAGGNHYRRSGELNLTELAEALELDHEQEFFGKDIDEAAEIVFEWAEATLPAGYYPVYSESARAAAGIADMFKYGKTTDELPYHDEPNANFTWKFRIGDVVSFPHNHGYGNATVVGYGSPANHDSFLFRNPDPVYSVRLDRPTKKTGIHKGSPDYAVESNMAMVAAAPDTFRLPGTRGFRPKSANTGAATAVLTNRKFQVGDPVFTSAGIRGRVTVSLDNYQYKVRLDGTGKEFPYLEAQLTAIPTTAPIDPPAARPAETTADALDRKKKLAAARLRLAAAAAMALKSLSGYRYAR